MKTEEYFSLKFENDSLIFLDQTRLPLEEIYIATDDYNRIAEAIIKLEIRGAPAIGAAAAYALALSQKPNYKNDFYEAFSVLASTRPTAVNLFFAINQIKNVYEKNLNHSNIFELLVETANNIFFDDVKKCDMIGENGIKIFTKKSVVLTHCNTGRLATCGSGTTFSVILNGFKNDLVSFVYVDETRPLFQGLRLTAFELEKNNIPYSVICDSAAASIISKNYVDLIIVGADRIASNGDTANKIGTLSLAVLANYFNIPFFVAAPTTTIDYSIKSGNEINIEERNGNEIKFVKDIPIVPNNFNTINYAFDVTPAELITGIITEKEIFYYPYHFSK